MLHMQNIFPKWLSQPIPVVILEGNKGKAKRGNISQSISHYACNSNRWNTSRMRFSQPEAPADVVRQGTVSGNFNDTDSRGQRGGQEVIELAEVKGHGLLLEVCAAHPVADESGASLLLWVTVFGQPVPNLSPLSLTSWQKCLGCLCWHTCERGCWGFCYFLG